jgi:sulfatase modifying factor 1
MSAKSRSALSLWSGLFLAVALANHAAAQAPPPVTPGEVITNSIGMKLTLIPAGEFWMGAAKSEGGQDDEQPVHRVRITRPFYLGQFEVTRGQFAQFVSDQSYKTEAEQDGKGGYGTDDKGNWTQKPEYTWRNPGFAQTDDHPVVNVSWHDADAFCKWLSRKEGKTYRLPTEAEWEYACRAGTTTPYFHGADPEGLAAVGNVADGTAKAKFSSWSWTINARDGYVYTAPVGKFRPNAFGLYDMHGNVWEWCADWYAGDYYRNSPVDDPQGPSSGSPQGWSSGSARIHRGGSWLYAAGDCRSAFRGRFDPSHRINLLGFRLALSPSGR